MSILFTGEFWRALAFALLRTILAGLVPFMPALFADPAGTWGVAVGTVGLLAIATIFTSLKGIPDPAAAPWWQILLSRGLRQFGQFALAGVGPALLLTDVNWQSLLLAAAASAASTIVMAALTLMPADYEPQRYADDPPAELAELAQQAKDIRGWADDDQGPEV